MNIFRFDCVFYYVRDLDRAIEFYRDAFGLQLASRDEVARFDVDGVLVELVPAAGPEGLVGGGNARLTLRVEDITVALQELRAKGVRTSGVRHVPNGRLSSAYDLDGNEICLWQYC